MHKLNLQDLDLLQQDIFDWAKRNFPHADGTQELLGVMEEIGELTHAHLKQMQLIRGYQDGSVAFADKTDAVGDALIYLFNYCSFEGINLRGALEDTWYKVSQRDWISDPTNAGNEKEPIASRKAPNADS